MHPGAEADVVADVAGALPLPATVDADDLRLRLAGGAEVCGEPTQGRSQNAFSLRWPPSVSPSSVSGSWARIRICACATVAPSSLERR